MQQCLNIASGFVTIGEAALQGQTSERAAVALSSLGMRPNRGDRSLNRRPGTVVSISPSGRVRLGTGVVMGVSVATPPYHYNNDGGSSTSVL